MCAGIAAAGPIRLPHLLLRGAKDDAPLSLFPVQTLWTLALNNQLTAPPAFGASRGFFSIEGDRIVTYDLSSGTQTWMADAAPQLEPAVGEGLLFIVETESLAALRVDDGGVAWRLPFAQALAAPPVWDNGWLIVATADREILAFRGVDGHLVWRRYIGANAHARPALAADRVYVPTEDGRVVALDVATGELLWERALQGAANDILAFDERIYVGSNDNNFYCLLAEKGEVDWKWRTGGDVVGLAAADEHHVYFVSLDNVMRALDRKSGGQIWKTALPLRPARGPVLAGGTLIVTGLSSTARAYDTKDGKVAGDVAAGAELAAGPHLVAGTGTAALASLPTLIVVTRDIAKGATVTALTRSIDPPIVPMAPLPNPALITAVR
ncbi:MAG TPA: PQQ-binding-like beta-propeller repeat protein [Vicinamibacterales bacterium]|nr:PQQ-binding-like beta-propeller repeat protein [Vicinamibacterales bacterium]